MGLQNDASPNASVFIRGVTKVLVSVADHYQFMVCFVTSPSHSLDSGLCDVSHIATQTKKCLKGDYSLLKIVNWDVKLKNRFNVRKCAVYTSFCN